MNAKQVKVEDIKSEELFNGSESNNPKPKFNYGPPPEFWQKQNRLVNQIMITDVTTNDMTITVRECRTPQGFFKERTEMKSIAVSTDATSDQS